MWFRQAQIFQLSISALTIEKLLAQLALFAFKPCLSSMPTSIGWVSPLNEDEAPLARGLNSCMMICLQIEEKILPASVINTVLAEKIKLIEQQESRKIRQKEKLNLKDEITYTLLPRAFSKFTRIPAYIDMNEKRLVLNTISPTKTAHFISLFKKSFGDVIQTFDTAKPSSILTNWLKTQNYPTSFSINKSCVLQDPNQQNRVITAKEQNLFTQGIQSLLKEGCEAIQIGLCWQDKIDFVFSQDCSLRGIKLAENDMVELKDELETAQERFDANFILMTESFKGLVNDILSTFSTKNHQASDRLALAS